MIRISLLFASLLVSLFGSLVFTHSTLALTYNERYNSGYNHGCSDGRTGGHPYLNSHRGHTQVFMQGYNNGYDNCSGHVDICDQIGNAKALLPVQVANSFNKQLCGDTVKNSPPKSTRYDENWWGTCRTIQWALVYSCNTYVRPDGSLTQEGSRAKDCISGGAFLGGAAKLIGGIIPTDWIIEGLRMLAPSYNCENIVKWDVLKQGAAALDFFASL